MKNKKEYQKRRAKQIARHERKRKAVKKWLRVIGFSPPAKGYKTVKTGGKLVRVYRFRFAQELYTFVKDQIKQRVQRRIQMAFIKKQAKQQKRKEGDIV